MAKRTVQAEDLYDVELITDIQISPDGRTVAYTLQRVDRKTEKKFTNIWLAPARGGKPRQFTYGDQNDAHPRWSPDGRQLAFLSNRRDEKQTQIFLIPLAGGEARPLTTVEGALGGFVWSPDGRQIALTLRAPDPEAKAREADAQKKQLGVVARHYDRIFYKGDGMGYLPPTRFHIWVVDARSGKATQLTSDDRYDEGLPAWSPDGKTLAFAANRHADPDLHPNAVTLYTIPAAGGEVTEIPIDHPYQKRAPAYSPDGQWLLYQGRRLKDSWWQNNDLYVVPAGGGTARNLTAAHDLHCAAVTINDVGGGTPASNPVWAGDSGSITFYASRHGSQPLYRIDLDGNLETVIDLQGVIGGFSLDASQATAAYFRGDLADTGQVWTRQMDGGRERRLTNLNGKLHRRGQLSQIEEMWIKGPEGNDLQGWIMFPPDFDAAKKYPAILEIHGGPQTQYGHMFMHEFYYLAAGGYVVFFSNPRGSQGYGNDHCGAIHGRWGTVDYDDVMAWTDYVTAQPYVDTGRLGVTGGSYGGYMTSWIIGHTNRFHAAVAQRVVSNFISMWGSCDFNYGFVHAGGRRRIPLGQHREVLAPFAHGPSGRRDHADARHP